MARELLLSLSVVLAVVTAGAVPATALSDCTAEQDVAAGDVYVRTGSDHGELWTESNDVPGLQTSGCTHDGVAVSADTWVANVPPDFVPGPGEVIDEAIEICNAVLRLLTGMWCF